MSNLELPTTLITAIQEQRAILFLGAGASYDAVHPRNQKIPSAERLSELICKKYFDSRLMDKPLTSVAAFAAAEVGMPAFQKYVREIFVDFTPADFHLLIPTFRWRAIVTTNFDLIVERAYENCRGAVQNYVSSWKDGDLFDNRLNETANPVGLYKIHGCIDHLEETVPLILGQEQYASYLVNRGRFYNRLRDLAYDNTILFCGYSISDPHIQQFLFDLTDKAIKRPLYYCVDPGITDIESRYWLQHQVNCVPATFKDFLNAIDKKISTMARSIARPSAATSLSLVAQYRSTRATESEALRYFVENDVVHVRGGLVPQRQDAIEFYRGYDIGFGSIVQDLDIARPVTDSILVDAILLDDEGRKDGELFLLKGPGGSGKTVSLKRVAWEAATEYGKIALYVLNAAGVQFEPLAELYQLTGKRIFLFVDRVALVRDELSKLLRSARSRKLPLTVLGAERENEWNIYCENLESFVAQDFAVGSLSKEEVVELLRKLETHRALGVLAEKNPAERLEAFLVRAERQLLVALHETTLGVPFEKIVLDEYHRVRPGGAQQLYLQICALHQFGAPVRAGLVSRTSGVSFQEFGTQFFKPLQELVLVEDGTQSGRDVLYKSRHQHVAELVFNQVLPSGEEKYDLLARLIQSMNIDYASDRETFSRLIRGRSVARLFTDINLGRLLYDKAEAVAKGEPFVQHQRAVFEMQHDAGSLESAERASARAARENPQSRSIRHTQAEIARRRALEATDPLLKQAFRRAARERLSDAIVESEYDLHTRARVAIDELREAAANGKSGDAAVLSATKDAETSIQRAREIFPENAELLAAEADLREILNQQPQALAALEKAFRLNRRQDWLATRLSKKYAQSSQTDRALETLGQCLKENPESKIVHFELAQLLRQTGAPTSKVLDHLRRSFTTGDNNFEAQFWCGRELFLDGRIKEANSIFSSLTERAPGSFRVKGGAAVISGDHLRTFRGEVSRKEEGYAFIRLYEFPEDIFSSRADNSRREWDAMRTGSKVNGYLEFNRRGPKVTRITLRST